MLSYVCKGTEMVWVAPMSDRHILVTALGEPDYDGNVEVEDSLGWVANVHIEDCRLADRFGLLAEAKQYSWAV